MRMASRRCIPGDGYRRASPNVLLCRRLAFPPAAKRHPALRRTQLTRGPPVPPFRLMAVLAHPDDESLGFGGALVRYGNEGIETSLVTATLGQKGRYRGLPPSDPGHPGTERIAAMREAELRAACEVIGIR